MPCVHQSRCWLAGLVTAACAVALIAVPCARADGAPFSVIPQAPMVSTPPGTDDEQGRTDQTTVTFEVEGSWTQLSCQLDDQADTSCGTPVTPCPVAQCTELTRTGLRPGTHSLSVSDAYGDWQAIEGDEYTFFVDLTPPRAYLAELAGSGTHPKFEFDWKENDESIADTAQCSFTVASAPPSWGPCQSDDSLAPTLPDRNVQYVFRGEAIDDLGRASNVVTVPYDPVPCTLAPLHTMRALPFELHGMAYSLHCVAATQSVQMQLFLLGQNGHDHSLASAIHGNDPLNEATFGRRLSRHGHQRLPLDDSLDNELKLDRTARFALVVTPSVGPRYNAITGMSAARIFNLRN